MRFAPSISLACLALSIGLAGCGLLGEKKKLPPPIEYVLDAPYAEPHTLAIAPAINLSGSRDFDPLVVSDILFSEMQQVRNLTVLPLNKTIMAMQRLGVRTIDNVQVAQKLAEMLGADGLVIPAVTAYDPYNPPTIGMVLQLYTPAQPDIRGAVADARPVKAPTIQTNPDTPVIATDVPVAPTPQPRPPLPAQQPVAQVNAMFNASNQTVLRELRGFAAGRSQYDSALVEQRFLMDSEAYMRFVCHAMVRRLMDVERNRVSDR